EAKAAPGPSATAPAPAKAAKAEAAKVANAAPAAAASTQAAPHHPAPNRHAPEMQYRSIGPGGFIRQGPGDQQPPIPPAPPRRLVPAKPRPADADKTTLSSFTDRLC